MTFTEWLAEQIDRDDPVGEFAMTLVFDESWPKAKSLFGHVRHLKTTGGGAATYRLLVKVWQEYEEVNNGMS